MSHRIYSRSAVTCDWKCPRQRWWRYEAEGQGIVTGGTNLALFLGTVLHDGLAALAEGLDIEAVALAANDEIQETLVSNAEGEDGADTFAKEQACLIEGLLRGFDKNLFPTLKQSYPKIYAVEQEVSYEHDGLLFVAKPDLILQDHNGDNWYFEHKSTSSNRPEWVSSWSTAVQLHSSVRAVEASLGIKIAGVIVQGFYKGYKSKYNRQESILCYGYHKAGEPPFTDDQWSYIYKPGLRKYPVWQMEGGVKRWVEEMPDELLASQFIQVPPISINEHLLDSFFNQRAIREHEIFEAAKQINRLERGDKQRLPMLERHFPQVFEACRPAWGSECEYRMLCHGFVEDPYSVGYVPRVSHHQIEQDAIDGAKER